MSKHSLILLSSLLLAGCASRLTVYDSAGSLLPGVPVPTSMTYLETGHHTKLAKGGECERVPYHTTVSLPVGPPVFVNVKPAQFAKTGLVIKFAGNGAAQEISLNTEPSGADFIKNTADAIKTIASVVGVAASPNQPGGPLTNLPPCDSVPDPATLARTRLVL